MRVNDGKLEGRLESKLESKQKQYLSDSETRAYFRVWPGVHKHLEH